MMVLYLTEENVRQLLTMPITIEAVEEAFRLLGIGQAENLPRRRLHSSKGMFNIMSASLSTAGYMGYKCYTVFPGKMKFRIFLHSSVMGNYWQFWMPICWVRCVPGPPALWRLAGWLAQIARS